MRDLLGRFSLDAVKFDSQLLVCALFVWVLVLVCSVFSIIHQSFTRKQRWFWILMIVCLPGLGLLVYLPFSLGRTHPSRSYRTQHNN